MSTLICFEKRNVRKLCCQWNRNFQMSLPSGERLYTSLSLHSSISVGQHGERYIFITFNWVISLYNGGCLSIKSKKTKNKNKTKVLKSTTIYWFSKLHNGDLNLINSHIHLQYLIRTDIRTEEIAFINSVNVSDPLQHEFASENWIPRTDLFLFRFNLGRGRPSDYIPGNPWKNRLCSWVEKLILHNYLSQNSLTCK